MKSKRSWLSALYGWLLRLYPHSYHALFADEMEAVFTQALIAARTQGWAAVLRLCGRELRDLPHLLCTEYWLFGQQWLQARLFDGEAARTDLPGVVPVGYGSVPHLLFVVTGRSPRLRRLFDLVIALCGLMMAAPVLLVLSILIKVDSPGPVLYRQQRIGKQGQLYTMYKFRSMHINSSLPVQGVTHHSGHEPRLTRIGRWVRRYYLDEMPQLFNILKGDMSVFGPRPPMPGQSS